MNVWCYWFFVFALIILLSVSFAVSVVLSVIRLIRKRKALGFLIWSAATLVLLSAVIVFVCFHPTYPRYNDVFVIGNSVTKVSETYGEFDIGSYKEGKSGYVGYYIYTDNGPIMPDHMPHYYYIKYDENGIVTEVYDGCAQGG